MDNRINVMAEKWSTSLMRHCDIIEMQERVRRLEAFVTEVRDCVPDLFGAGNDLIDVAVLESFQTDALELMPFKE